MNKYLNVAQDAARQAGKLMLEARDRLEIESKSNAIDLVTSVDRDCERLIRALLESAFPDIPILGEEEGGEPQDGLCWVVDPIDGTTNFVHGFPFFCCSIALVESGKPVVGVVYQPSCDKLFSAVRSQGATVNGEPLRVSTTQTLESALLATGFPYDRAEKFNYYLSFWRELLPRTRGIRRCGSAAMDLAMVACGALDGFWEDRLAPWDVAAGILLVEEAGGVVTDIFGNELDLWRPRPLVASRSVHEALSPVIGALAQ